ncbi:hypothetical protein GWI33_005977 [Rhynchophorus ferrugineus]|uniref:Origin recognition complex subunit 3 n=1 Tax=Rhynchophorus ferrugineus TaxID=354439 RepID=A0A834MNJ3_RHYFE|nr:hypothetical protein GWI33_005977 [Rhynchophorus ferrugineus]
MVIENETVSVSKGVFIFKNNFKPIRKSKKDYKKCNRNDNIFTHNLWYQEYSSLWNSLFEDIQKLTSNIFSVMTKDLLEFIKSACNSVTFEIPTAALLTGINMPDHVEQFIALEKQLKDHITPHVATLNSQDCSSMKFLMENLVNQFLNGTDYIYLDEDDMETDQCKDSIKKSFLNFSLLESWYWEQYASRNKCRANQKPLVVIFPDFESFNINILQKFILVASSHLKKLPFVFVFGIATSVSILYYAFPYHVSSKISIKMFKCEQSINLLNNVLENIFLNSFCPFQLGGNVFNLFTDIFLFYDYSVHNFIQNIKYTMMEHFCYGNAMALCNLDKKEVKDMLNIFKHEDFENVRQLKSFRKLVESQEFQNRINLLTNDEYLKNVIFENVLMLQRYIRRLHIFLKCLHVLVHDLPGYPLGKQLRELYAICVSENVCKTQQYNECFQLLGFQSKEDLCLKLEKILDILASVINENSKKTQLKDFFCDLKKYKNLLVNLTDFNVDIEEKEKDSDVNNSFTNQMDRKALKQTLLLRSKQKPKSLNKYEKLRIEILDQLSQNFKIYLVEPSSLYLYEIFFFDNISIQNKIIGIHRSAIHTALNNPHYYLQCNCCEISNTHSIKRTMPDVCIAYKLHLECGKMINMYDWLQAFICIIDVDGSKENENQSKKVDPQIQARFTRAVAELEYLGFIKSSKRKADHVTRLTWGG